MLTPAPLPPIGKATTLLKWVRVVAALAILAVALTQVRRLDLAATLTAARGANLFLVGVAALINLPLMLSKALRLRALSPTPLRTRRVTAMYFASYAADTLLVSQSGPIARIAFLRREGLRLSLATSLQVIEKVLDALGLALVVVPLSFVYAASLPSTTVLHRLMIGGLIIGALAILGAVAGFLLLRALAQRRGASSQAAVILDTAASLTARPVATRVVLFTAVGWGLEILIALVVVRAMHLSVPFAAAATAIVISVSFAALIPGLPANVGPFEASCVLALSLYGVGESQGLATAIVYHAAHTIPATLLGLPSLLILRPTSSREPDPAARA